MIIGPSKEWSDDRLGLREVSEENSLDSNNSLVGRIKVVYGMGIRMRNNNDYEVMGYVIDLSEDKIALSTNHPLNNFRGAYGNPSLLSTKEKVVIYDLKDFTHYTKQVDEE